MASVKVDRDLVRVGNDWYAADIFLNPGWHEYQLILGFHFPHLDLIPFILLSKKVWERCCMYQVAHIMSELL